MIYSTKYRFAGATTSTFSREAFLSKAWWVIYRLPQQIGALSLASCGSSSLVCVVYDFHSRYPPLTRSYSRVEWRGYFKISLPTLKMSYWALGMRGAREKYIEFWQIISHWTSSSHNGTDIVRDMYGKVWKDGKYNFPYRRSSSRHNSGILSITNSGSFL